MSWAAVWSDPGVRDFKDFSKRLQVLSAANKA
jgi:hypothetical protein